MYQLDLSYCKIGQQNYGGFLKHFKNLQMLNLCANNLGDEGAVTLANGLTFCSNLESLYLGLNKIGEDGIVALSNALANNQSLKLLHFSDILVCPSRNVVNDNAALAFSNLFIKCKQLQSLAFRDCELTNAGLAFLTKGLQHCSNLRMLDLSGNSVSIDTGVANCLRHCSKVQILKLNGMTMNNSVAIAISACLKTLGDLQVLDLSLNFMQDYEIVHCNSEGEYHYFHASSDAIPIICRCLIDCSSLQELYLNDCVIGDYGICCLAESLIHCKSLSKLGLEKNLMSVIGAEALVEGMKHCPSV